MYKTISILIALAVTVPNGIAVAAKVGDSYFPNRILLATTTSIALFSTEAGAYASTSPQMTLWVAGSSSPSFIVDGANHNGNVGIATTTPGTLFSIQGVANFSTATSTFQGTGGVNITSG